MLAGSLTPTHDDNLRPGFIVDSQVTDAIYTGGILKPLGDLKLRESERVRLIVQRCGPVESRDAALERLRAGIENMNLHLSGPLPRRDELHDRD